MLTLTYFAIAVLFAFFFQTPTPTPAPEPNPFELPVVALLTAALIGPTKIAVDIIKGAVTSIPAGALPLVGLIAAFGLGIIFERAIGATFTSQLWAQIGLAALGGQGGAMLSTALQDRANVKRLNAGK